MPATERPERLVTCEYCNGTGICHRCMGTKQVKLDSGFPWAVFFLGAVSSAILLLLILAIFSK